MPGCATNYVAKFYHDFTAGTPTVQVNKRLMPYSGITKVYSSADQQKDCDILAQHGYIIIGGSEFEGSVTVTEGQLMEQGKKVGADIVLFSSNFKGSSQSVVPFVQYHPGATSTTYSSGTVHATAYGTGGRAYGTATYSGTSTTTSPGSFSTSMMPVTVHRYGYTATFLRKGRPPVLGILPGEIPASIKKRLDRNSGAYVNIVIDDSPAFHSNILVGDIVIALNDTEIMTPQHLLRALQSMPTRTISVRLIRDGAEKTVPVILNPMP